MDVHTKLIFPIKILYETNAFNSEHTISNYKRLSDLISTNSTKYHVNDCIWFITEFVHDW